MGFECSKQCRLHWSNSVGHNGEGESFTNAATLPTVAFATYGAMDVVLRVSGPSESRLTSPVTFHPV